MFTEIKFVHRKIVHTYRCMCVAFRLGGYSMCDDNEPDEDTEEDWTDDEKCSPVPISNERVKTERPLAPQGRIYWPLNKR